ncbi:MAG TPA: uracil-DNA glycosylase, partial [Solirubrobacteraceae bacterium]|nr:uracil-DNA glycosylase [Solirubrobacteraceae bacterium]
MSSGESELSASERREALKEVLAQARGCVRCPELASTRKTVVFGAGNADAELMFVGEAPGASEDEQGLPFVGRAGKLLEQLLGEIGMERGDVFICNVLKCRPPGNRDPLPVEIENCQEYLLRQVELIQPTVICTLGNFSTKLLRGDPTGITRLHGQPEVRELGARAVQLYPIYHPAAALYTPRMLETLREDFARLP